MTTRPISRHTAEEIHYAMLKAQTAAARRDADQARASYRTIVRELVGLAILVAGFTLIGIVLAAAGR